MKVLLAFPMADKQTGLYINHAFEDLGHDIIIVDSNLNPYDLFPVAKENNPDFIFCSRTPGLTAGILKIKSELPNIKILGWNVDSRDDAREFSYIFQLANACDIFYTKAFGNVEQFQRYCPNTIVKELQEGIDPKYHNKFEPTEEDDIYTCDVLFAGDYQSVVHEGRIELLNHLLKQDFDFKIWGNNSYLLNEEHSRACQKAKIVLGHTGWPNVSTAMSARDYRVMGAGGFLLTNHVKDIDKWINVGYDCITYTTPKDCVDKIRYYLNNDSERLKIAENGYLSTHKKHKFSDRLKEVIKDVNSIQ